MFNACREFYKSCHPTHETFNVIVNGIASESQKFTTSISKILEIHGKIEIGRKCSVCSLLSIFGIGLIRAIFHCRGLIDFSIQLFKIAVMGPAK